MSNVSLNDLTHTITAIILSQAETGGEGEHKYLKIYSAVALAKSITDIIRQHEAQLTKTPENVTKETASNISDTLNDWPADAQLKEDAFDFAMLKAMPSWKDGDFIDGGNILAIVGQAIDYYNQRLKLQGKLQQREISFDKSQYHPRYVIGEKAIADCFPRSADETGIYHLDYGNLQALVHTAIEIHENATKREYVDIDRTKIATDVMVAVRLLHGACPWNDAVTIVNTVFERLNIPITKIEDEGSNG